MSDQLPTRDGPTPDTNIQSGIPTAPRLADAIVYQSVSAWAVVGLVVSGLLALLVLGSTIIALWQGEPFFFPTWFVLGLALVGITLSFVGQNHIQNSDGTRTGARLATIGIWLGVLSGLCYFSYFFATRYAQEAQANNFLLTESESSDTGFFHHLRKAGANPTEMNIAFLLTRPQTVRAGNPKDPKGMALINDQPGKEGKGELSAFKDHVMTRVLFKGLGKEAEIIPLAVQDWRYEKKSYQMTRNYLIKTKEVELEMTLTVASIEGEVAGQERTWFLNLRESGPVIPDFTKSLTKYGQGVFALRARAREWVERKWLPELDSGKPLNALKDMDQTPWRDLVFKDQKSEEVKAAIYREFESSKKDRFKGMFSVTTQPHEVGWWELVDGKIRMYLNFRLLMVKEGPPPPDLGRTVEGYVMVQTRQAIDPLQFDFNSPLPEWNLVGIAFTQSTPPAKKEQ